MIRHVARPARLVTMSMILLLTLITTACATPTAAAEEEDPPEWTPCKGFANVSDSIVGRDSAIACT